MNPYLDQSASLSAFFLRLNHLDVEAQPCHHLLNQSVHVLVGVLDYIQISQNRAELLLNGVRQRFTLNYHFITSECLININAEKYYLVSKILQASKQPRWCHRRYEMSGQKRIDRMSPAITYGKVGVSPIGNCNWLPIESMAARHRPKVTNPMMRPDL